MTARGPGSGRGEPLWRACRTTCRRADRARTSQTVPRIGLNGEPSPYLTWEPVSGFEPLTCRLQEIRPRPPCALAARMARVIALTAPTALELFCASSHETVPRGWRTEVRGRNRA